MREIAIRVPAESAEDVLDRLLPIAPYGVYERPFDGEVELRVRGPVDELPPREAVATAARGLLRWSGERELPEDWDAVRRLDHEPLVIGERLALRPAWAPPPPEDLIDLVLCDTHAFGSGTHPTTRECLETLLDLPRKNGDGPLSCKRGSFADLGCGSGVLAIAAAKLGFEPVLAIDRETEAAEAARANAVLNGVTLDIRVADLETCPPPDAATVAANVPLALHLQLAEELPRRPAVLVASGIHVHEVDQAVTAYRRRGMRLRELHQIGEWAVLVLRSRRRSRR